VTDQFDVPDGIIEIKEAIPDAIRLIVKTARWVHPETFRALPVWYPETARGRPVYDATWTSPRANRHRESGRVQTNVKAQDTLIAALGTRRTPNWTVCHLWGYDDPTFAQRGSVVADPRYYTCPANMIWLPTPLKGFTDAVPEIKTMLRTCAYYFYGWLCEHENAAQQAAMIRAGAIPSGYPSEWPSKGKPTSPPGVAPFSNRVAAAIEKRKRELRTLLSNSNLRNFPRDEVRNVLAFWNMTL